MSRSSRTGRSLTKQEAKSAAFKESLAEARAKDSAKTARLKALRLAKEAEDKR